MLYNGEKLRPLSGPVTIVYGCESVAEQIRRMPSMSSLGAPEYHMCIEPSMNLTTHGVSTQPLSGPASEGASNGPRRSHDTPSGDVASEIVISSPRSDT